MKITTPLPSAFLPLIEAQRPCFGFRLDTDPACQACFVEVVCEQLRQQKLEAYAQDWERNHRIGSKFALVPVLQMTACQHCRGMIRPEEGNMGFVEGRGTYHPQCVDLAFPAPKS